MARCIDCKYCVKLPDVICGELEENDLYVCAIPHYIENGDDISELEDNDYMWTKCEVVLSAIGTVEQDNDGECELFEYKS